MRKILPIFEKLKHNIEITLDDLNSLGYSMTQSEFESSIKSSHRTESNIFNTNKETRDLAERYIQNEFKELMNLNRITGFPLNLPYSDIQFISESVYATGVHKISSSNETNELNTEFVLAVYVHPYPANVFSVWVYIGAVNVI